MRGHTGRTAKAVADKALVCVFQIFLAVGSGVAEETGQSEVHAGLSEEVGEPQNTGVPQRLNQQVTAAVVLPVFGGLAGGLSLSVKDGRVEHVADDPVLAFEAVADVEEQLLVPREGLGHRTHVGGDVVVGEGRKDSSLDGECLFGLIERPSVDVVGKIQAWVFDSDALHCRLIVGCLCVLQANDEISEAAYPLIITTCAATRAWFTLDHLHNPVVAPVRCTRGVEL